MHFKGDQQAKSNSENKAPQFVRTPDTIVGSSWTIVGNIGTILRCVKVARRCSRAPEENLKAWQRDHGETQDLKILGTSLKRL